MDLLEINVVGAQQLVLKLFISMVEAEKGRKKS